MLKRKFSIRKYINNKLYCYLIIVVVLISFIPILVLGMYNRPSADDFNYAINTFHVWNESGSIGELLKSAIMTSVEFWNTWQGLYISAFLLSLQPGIFGGNWYVMTSIIMMSLIVGSTVFFSNYFIKRIFGRKALEATTIGFIMSFLMIQYMPSALEGLYWFNGAVNYGFFFAYLLMHICSIVELQCSESVKKQNLLFTLCIINTFILGGGNHVTALMSVISIFVIVVAFWKKNRRITGKNILIFICSVTFLFLNIGSPGTKIRAMELGGESLGKINIIWAAFRAMWEAMRNIGDWFSFKEVAFIIMILPILIGLTSHIREKYHFAFKYPLLIIIGSVAWLSIMYCPPFYALGGCGADRLINIVYYFYVILVFINATYLVGWAQNFVDKEKLLKLQISNDVFLLTVIVFAFALFLSSILNTWSVEAFKELYSGEAAIYAAQYDERDEKLTNSKGLDVLVERFDSNPKMLFFDDITGDEKQWKNSGVSRYYGLKSIKINEK